MDFLLLLWYSIFLLLRNGLIVHKRHRFFLFSNLGNILLWSVNKQHLVSSQSILQISLWTKLILKLAHCRHQVGLFLGGTLWMTVSVAKYWHGHFSIPIIAFIKHYLDEATYRMNADSATNLDSMARRMINEKSSKKISFSSNGRNNWFQNDIKPLTYLISLRCHLQRNVRLTLSRA